MKHTNSTKIIRSRNTTKYNFTPISNEFIQSKTLSLEAKGLVMFILSLPENFVIYKTWVQKELEMGDIKFDRIWKECVNAGYISVDKVRVDGRFNYHYEISDTKLSTPRVSSPSFSTPRKPTTINKNQGKKIHEEKIYLKNNLDTRKQYSSSGESLVDLLSQGKITLDELSIIAKNL